MRGGSSNRDSDSSRRSSRRWHAVSRCGTAPTTALRSIEPQNCAVCRDIGDIDSQSPCSYPVRNFKTTMRKVQIGPFVNGCVFRSHRCRVTRCKPGKRRANRRSRLTQRSELSRRPVRLPRPLRSSVSYGTSRRSSLGFQQQVVRTINRRGRISPCVEGRRPSVARQSAACCRFLRR